MSPRPRVLRDQWGNYCEHTFSQRPKLLRRDDAPGVACRRGKLLDVQTASAVRELLQGFPWWVEDYPEGRSTGPRQMAQQPAGRKNGKPLLSDMCRK